MLANDIVGIIRHGQGRGVKNDIGQNRQRPRRQDSSVRFGNVVDGAGDSNVSWGGRRVPPLGELEEEQ
jgi:hypothetical protein